MHLLPTNLGRLAEHTSDTGARFALGCVRLRVHGDNTFIAEATDTKVLLRVSGPCHSPADEFPDANVPGFATAPNGETESLVPAAAWKKTFAAAKKLTGKARVMCLRAVATKIGEKVTTLAASDLTSHQCESVQNGEGRYPPTDDILSTKRGGNVRAAFSVDPILLADLLKTAADIACDPTDLRVEFEVRKPGHPITIRAGGSEGLKVHAVIMPLADAKKPAEGATEDAEAAATVDRFSARLAELERENDKLRSSLLDSKGRETAESGEKPADVVESPDLRAEVERLRAENDALKAIVERKDNQLSAMREANTRTVMYEDRFQSPVVPSTFRPQSRRERLALLIGGRS